MPNEIPPPRLIVEEEVHLWAGQTDSTDAIANAGKEELPENPKATLAEIRNCPAYKDPRHKDHQLALDQERRLCFGIVHAADKAEADAQTDVTKLNLEEQAANFSDADVDRIDDGALALGGTPEAAEQIKAHVAKDPDAVRQLTQLGYAERNFPGTGEFIRQHGGLSPTQAQRLIGNRRADPDFMKAYHDNQNPNQVASIAEMQALHAIAAGEITRWQQQQQQAQPQS